MGSRVETATVLFTDLVGSTELRSRLGEEAADTLRLTHDEIVRAAILDGGGTVVKHTGDGLMATFAGAAEAVSGAVAVQQALDQHNRTSVEAELTVRIGISTGDVTFEGEDCFGLPVVEAQRLEAAAEGGQILCSDLVRLMARGRGGHEFTSVGELELKGLDEPVPAALVRWEPSSPAPEPGSELPPALRIPSPFGLAGRSAPLETLVDAWKETVAGGRQLVLVSGEPGLGKTRLVAELARRAFDQGGRVLAGRSDEDLGLPYQPFVEALRWQLIQSEDPTEALGSRAGELVRLVPELAQRVPGLPAPYTGEPESERLRLFEAVASWLGAGRAHLPTLLVLDDIHWADGATLQLVRYLVSVPIDSILMVGTYRDTDLDRRHPLSGMLADLRRRAGVTRLALDRLDEEGVTEFVRLASGGEAQTDQLNQLAHALFSETGGNPFFVSEVLRHLAETGAIYHDAQRGWTTDLDIGQLAIPEGIREVVGRRISRLSEDTEQCLRAAAVIGNDFGLELLAAVIDEPEDDVVDTLDEAISAGVISEVGPGQYRFAHALVRATLDEELSTTRRTRAHRRVAETLEQIAGGDPDELDSIMASLAYHWGESATSGESPRALECAIRAGELAAQRHLGDEAARWYEQALEIVGDDTKGVGQRIDLLTRLGRAKVDAGSLDWRRPLQAAAELARDADNTIALANAMVPVLLQGNAANNRPPDPARVELMETALERLGDSEPVLRAQLLGRLGVELIYTGEVDRRTALLEEARQLAEHLDDEGLRLQIAVDDLFATPPSVWFGRRDTWRRAVQPVIDIIEADSQDPTAARAAGALTWGALLFGYGDEARLRHEQGYARSAEEGDPEGIQLGLARAQVLALVEGRIRDSIVLSFEVSQTLEQIGRIEDARQNLGVRLHFTYRERGQLANLIQPFEEDVGQHPPAGPGRALLAMARAFGGDPDGARADLDAAMERLDEINNDGAWPMTFGALAETALALGDTEASAEITKHLERASGCSILTGMSYAGSADRLIARHLHAIGDDGASDRFAAALDFEHRVKSPTWIARTLLDRAEYRVGAGDVAGARADADEALRTIGELELVESRGRAESLREKL